MFDGIKILEAFNYRPPMNAADSSALQTVLDTEETCFNYEILTGKTGCNHDIFPLWMSIENKITVRRLLAHRKQTL